MRASRNMRTPSSPLTAHWTVQPKFCKVRCSTRALMLLSSSIRQRGDQSGKGRAEAPAAAAPGGAGEDDTEAGDAEDADEAPVAAPPGAGSCSTRRCAVRGVDAMRTVRVAFSTSAVVAGDMAASGGSGSGDDEGEADSRLVLMAEGTRTATGVCICGVGDGDCCWPLCARGGA